MFTERVKIIWIRPIAFSLLSLFLILCSNVYAQTDSIALIKDTLVVPTDTIVTADTVVVAEEPAAATPRKAKRDTIYQATYVKLDIASPAVTAGFSKGQLQHYEVAVSVRLKDRFFPTGELGYAGGQANNDSITYNGHGGFIRVGCDFNPLRKNLKSPHSLLVGVRLGTSVQGLRQGLTANTDRPHSVHADCWGEIVAGCQVEIAQVNKTAFYMGWMGRVKCLFTRQAEGLPAAEQAPLYIPGFGYRDNIGWGLNYHLGWRF